jgi:hypothetical protein
MTRTIVTFLAVALALLLGQAAFAAVDSTDLLIKALIDKHLLTEEEASVIRAEIATTRSDEEAARKSFPVTAKRPLRFSSYGQVRYTNAGDAAQNVGFEVKRLRLTLAADPTPDLDYKAQVDFAGAKSGLTKQGATPAAASSGLFSKPTLLDATVGYKFTVATRLTAGQFYVPFGLESTTSDALLDTVNRSQTTEKLVPGRDTSNQGRDIGVQISGTRALSLGSVDYAVGVFNGAGINTVADDNPRKDLAAHVGYRPLDGLTLGASYFNGATGATRVPHRRTGLELAYLRAPWALKSEYVTGKDDVRKKGYYVTLIRTLTPTLQAVARYDHVNGSVFKASDVPSTKVTTLGVNWFLSKDTLSRVVLNYDLKRENGPQVHNNQLLAQFQTGF